MANQRADREVLSTLYNTIASTTALLTHIISSLEATTPLPTLSKAGQPSNALAILTTASDQLHSLITKISLITITPPFSPRALLPLFDTLTNSIAPALVAATSLAAPTKYTQFLARTVRRLVTRTLREVRALLAEIPTTEAAVVTTQKAGVFQSTGVVWACCEEMSQCGKRGIREKVAEAVNGFGGLLEDAVQELEGWLEDGDEDGDEDSEAEAERALDGIDDITEKLGAAGIAQQPNGTSFSDGSTDPFELGGKASPATRVLAGKALAMLKLVQLLFPPLVKRRVKRFPEVNASTAVDSFPTQKQMERLDSLVEHCQGLSDEADELAGALYEGDEGMVECRLVKLNDLARECVGGVRENWESGEDEFTAWVDSKWMNKLNEL